MPDKIIIAAIGFIDGAKKKIILDTTVIEIKTEIRTNLFSFALFFSKDKKKGTEERIAATIYKYAHNLPLKTEDNTAKINITQKIIKYINKFFILFDFCNTIKPPYK